MTKTSDPRLELLSPQNSVLILCDHQPFMMSTIESGDRLSIVNSVAGLAEAASVLGVPTILTTIASHRSGAILPEIQAAFPDQEPIDRPTTMNAWDDERVVKAIEATNRRKIVIAGLWTEVCVAFPTITALALGYDVYVVVDACGGVSREAHEMAILRLSQAGAVPITWIAVMDEWQRDWAQSWSIPELTAVAKKRSAAVGVPIDWLGQLLKPTEAAA